MAKLTINKSLILVIMISANILFAQNQSIIIQKKSSDSLITKNNIPIADTSKFQMQKSAWGAVLRSTILPGFGQFYNESYWKIPVIWGVLGYLGYQWNATNNLYKKYRDLYSASVELDGSGINIYHRYREFYRDQRDLFAVFIGLTYFINLVDAFVDAHLFDFDVTNETAPNTLKLSMHMRL